MAAIANDLAGAAVPGCDWRMTIVEFASFMCVLRADRPPSTEEVCIAVGSWFGVPLDPTAAPLGRMLDQHWLASDTVGFRAIETGQRIVRPLIKGLVRMLDRGTRLLDVALMLTALRLCQGELDGDDHDR